VNDYCLGLVAYAIHHGPRVSVPGMKKPRPMTEAEAAAWLDGHCPAWRLGAPPATDGVIEVDGRGDEEEDEVVAESVDDLI
jgi:hypothetical protein